MAKLTAKADIVRSLCRTKEKHSIRIILYVFVFFQNFSPVIVAVALFLCISHSTASPVGYYVYFILFYFILFCYVTLRYVMLCYVMLCYVMLCYVMLCYVMLCYVMLCYFYFILFKYAFNFTVYYE